MKAASPLLFLALLLPACTPIPGYEPSDYATASDYQIAPIYQPSTPSYSIHSPDHYTFDAGGFPEQESGGQILAQRSRGAPSTTFSSDYHVDQTLGGNTRVSDRWGNSTTFDQNLDGSLRSTSNNGRTMTYSQSLNGYEARSSDGTTYRPRQNLGGGHTIEGSDGSSYTRTQTLGGGYRYERR